MKYTFILSAVILIIGCTQQTKRPTTFKGRDVNINVDSIKSPVRTAQNLKEIDLSDLCDSDEIADIVPLLDDYRLVILEATDNCLIGEINKVVLEDSLIFVQDRFVANKLFVFDNKGKFIRQIGSFGQGPEEYIQVTDFYYDKNSREILLYDQRKSRMMHFDLVGTYIKSDRQIFSYFHFTKTGDEYVYENLENRHLPGVNESYMTVGSDSIPVKYAFLPKLEIEYNSDNNMHKINDTTVAFCIPFFDTVYHYSQGILSAEYLIKPPKGKKRLPSNFQRICRNDYYNFRNEFPAKKYSYYQGEFFETDNYLQSSYSYNYTFFYNKSTKKITGGVKGYASNMKNDFERRLLFNPIISSFKDGFISSISPNIVLLYLSSKNPEKAETLSKYPELQNITSDDNPLLFIFKLKNE